MNSKQHAAVTVKLKLQDSDCHEPHRVVMAAEVATITTRMLSRSLVFPSPNVKLHVSILSYSEGNRYSVIWPRTTTTAAKLEVEWYLERDGLTTARHLEKCIAKGMGFYNAAGEQAGQIILCRQVAKAIGTKVNNRR